MKGHGMPQETISWDDLDWNKEPQVRTIATEEFTFEVEDSGPMVLLLSADNVKALRDMFRPLVEAASPAKKTRSTGGARSGPTAGLTPDELAAYRAWEDTNGTPVQRYVKPDGKLGGYQYSKERVDAWKDAGKPAPAEKPAKAGK